MYLENAVLYTFSTIPQTLGAAFAVLAAFVIYRFQDDPTVGHDIEQMLQMFAIADRTRLRDSFAAHGLKKLLEDMDNLFDTEGRPAPLPPGGQQYDVLMRLRGLADQPETKVPLRRAFFATGTVIVLSVTALCFEKPLAACTTWAAGALTLGVIGLAWCLWLYWKLIEPLISARRW